MGGRSNADCRGVRMMGTSFLTLYNTHHHFLVGEKPLITPVIAAAALQGRHTCAGRLQRPRLFTLSIHFARAARRKT